MKVRIIQTVEIDSKLWATEYNVLSSEVRQDVKDYFNNSCQKQVYRLNLHIRENAQKSVS